MIVLTKPYFNMTSLIKVSATETAVEFGIGVAVANLQWLFAKADVFFHILGHSEPRKLFFD